MKRHSPKVFRTVIGAAALIAACSLLTPYPADLARALKGTRPQSKPDIAVEDEPATRENASRGKEPSKTFVPTLPKQGTILADSVTRWRPKEPASLPPITLPPFPPVLPQKTNPGNYENFSSLNKGISLHTNVRFLPGTTAAADRTDKRSYTVTLSLDIVLPRAAMGKDLLESNPGLTQALAGYSELMKSARVSPFYHALYLAKQNQIRKNASSLAKLLDRHNFYDTDTVLEITAPRTGRRILWLQADMDVVSDGSDGDRLDKMPDKIVKSDNYQPSTSYRWKKRTKTPNPLLPVWEARLSAGKEARKKAPPARRKEYDARIDHAQRVVAELKTSSFLIAEYDPFIVLPLGMVNQRTQAFSPSFGDYAVVISGNRLFPAIVGDAGARYKTGEASLRMAKAINPKAGVYSRPVSDLSVSYLVFPGTAEAEKGPIDYARMNARCLALLREAGGLAPGAEFHEWEDLLAPPPEPETASENADKPGDAPADGKNEAPAAAHGG